MRNWIAADAFLGVRLKYLLLALTFIFLSLPAQAQALNPPSWATGYINVAAGTTVTTNITNSPTAPTNLNVTAGGAITTWNVRMPSPAFDGQLITIACPYGNVATLNVTALAPDTVQSGGPISCTSTPGQAVQYQYFQLLAQWTVLSTGTSPGGSGTMGMVNIAAGTNITLSGSCNSPTAINCTINTPASMGSVAIVAGTNITLSGTCTGTASINCTINTPLTAYSAGTGLTLTGAVFSLGGDSGNITYISPGQLQLGKSGTAGTLALGNATSGLLTLKAATGALSANSITFPASGGVIAADAFLGVGSGLTSSGGNLILGDGHFTYTLGSTLSSSVDSTLGSASARNGNSFLYTTHLTTTTSGIFANETAVPITMINWVGQNSFGGGTNAKTTFLTADLEQTSYAAGQRVGLADNITCYGGGDCWAMNMRVQYAGGPVSGDEGQAFSENQFLVQQQALSPVTIGVVPAQTLCNTTLTQNVTSLNAPQTVTVASSTNCNIGDWVVINNIGPTRTWNIEAVQLTAVAAGTISGIFLGNYTSGETVTPGVVLNTTGAFYGEQRVFVDKSVSYTTGTASGAATGVSNVFTGAGTTWANGMVGGNAQNAGCVTLAGDNVTGGTSTSFSVATPLQSWYQIIAVTSPTTLTISRTDTIGSGNYTGLAGPSSASFTGSISGTTLTTSAATGTIAIGQVLSDITAVLAPGTTILAGSGTSWTVSISQTVSSEAMTSVQGAYTISPCARILKVMTSLAQIVLESNPFTWTTGDSAEEIITPFPDVHGFIYDMMAYTPGGTYRDFMDIRNEGARQFGTGISVTSTSMASPSVNGDVFGWTVGFSVDHAVTGLVIGPNTPAAIQIASQASTICWGTFLCMAPNAVTSGSLISMNGAFAATNGCVGCLWSYFSGVGVNPTPQYHTLEYGGNILAQPHSGSETTLATAATVGFDPLTAAPNGFEKFMFTNTDGIGENQTTNKMTIYSSAGILIYGNTGGSDPTGTATPLGTATIFQGGSEAELALSNAAVTQNVTFTVSAAGVLTLGGNGGGSNGIIVGAETISSFAGTGSRPVCVTSTGVLEVGSLSAGLVTCP